MLKMAMARLRAAKAALKESTNKRDAGQEVLSEREEKRREFAREHGTILFIVFCDGTTKEVFCADNFTRYFDLQREIAKNTPRKNGIFAIQDKAGDIISSENFQPGHYYKIKELPKRHIPLIYPLVHNKWEFKKYHGQPRDWVDPVEAARLAEEARLQALEEARLLQIQLDKEAAEAEKRKAEEMKELIGGDEEWDDMLAGED